MLVLLLFECLTSFTLQYLQKMLHRGDFVTHYKKIWSYIIIFLLVFSYFPGFASADTSNEKPVNVPDITHVLFSDQIGHTITLYSEADEASETLFLLPDESEVSLLTQGEIFSQILYTNKESNEQLIGYVKNEYLVDIRQAEQTRNERIQKSLVDETKAINESEEGSKELNEENKNIQTDKQVSFKDIALSNDTNDQEATKPADEDMEEANTASNHDVNTHSIHSNTSEQLRGVTLKKTNVYNKASTSSEVLKSYETGSVLKYQTYSTDWYICTVYVNGKAQTGYIYKSDVENTKVPQQNLDGYSLANPTKVYEKPNENANVLKSYPLGKLLKFKSFTSE